AIRGEAIETRSLPTLTRSYPRRFTFYVADPLSSIETRSLPTLTHVLPISTSRFSHLCRAPPGGSVHSQLPIAAFYVDHSHGPVLAPATPAALPPTRYLHCQSATSGRVLSSMGNNYARDNVRKRAVRRKKAERLAAAKKDKKKAAK